MKRFVFSLLCILIASFAVNAQAAVSSFDDLTLDPDTHWGGAGSGETGFTSGDAYFPHNDSGYSWDGFVYSNETDTTTAGYTNQFSAITGSGVNGSSNYAVSYIPLDWESGTYDLIPQIVSFSAATMVSGAYFTNTTYAYLSMLDGDGFADPFGGTSGDEEDWFKLIIKGISASGDYTGIVEFYLADFTYSDNSLDYIIDDWTWVDLTILGNVIGLEFSLASSDVGDYGMNTPSYFAMDNLSTVPIPGAVWLLASGILGLIGLRKKVA